jgi:hypothetical protein
MAIKDFLKNRREKKLEEAILAFQKKGEGALPDQFVLNRSGEGIEDVALADAYGNIGLSSFNMFYEKYIQKQYATEVDKINNYRQMAEMPEIADVVEDATNESTQLDDNNKILHLQITNKDLAKNENMVTAINKEFEELFYGRINIYDFLWDLMRTYFIDGRCYYERIINKKKPKDGILNVKRLPSDTIDWDYNPKTGMITAFYQYLNPKAKKPKSFEEAEKDPNVIMFYPEQIGFINYGVYGKNRKDILGYLDKVRVPYNQLKLLETSVVIYRIIRAPERLVFKIDTGNMPKDKALKFVEKIKMKFTKKQTYNPDTGKLTHEPEILSMLENFFLPQSADGRGSDITSVGGDAKGFAELDDIYYFARKLYRALKYPQSRVTAQQEKQEGDVLFGGTSVGEISRDEIKWAKFLEKQQNRITDELLDLFMLHLQFKGLQKEYGITRKSLNLAMNPPNQYKYQMEQNFLQQHFDNYQTLANNEEFSKAYLMKKYLGWDDDEIKTNSEGIEKDIELGFREGPEEGGF